MNAGLIILRIASEKRDAQNERDGAGLCSSISAATLSQQQLRRSSSSVAAAAPSQQHYNLALKWSSNRRVPPRGATGSTSRKDAAAPRGGSEGRELRAVSAPSQ